MVKETVTLDIFRDIIKSKCIDCMILPLQYDDLAIYVSIVRYHSNRHLMSLFPSFTTIHELCILNLVTRKSAIHFLQKQQKQYKFKSCTILLSMTTTSATFTFIYPLTTTNPSHSAPHLHHCKGMKSASRTEMHVICAENLQLESRVRRK